jgi:hypothetical protein
LPILISFLHEPPTSLPRATHRQAVKDAPQRISLGLAQIDSVALAIDIEEEDGHVLGRIVGDDPIPARFPFSAPAEPNLPRTARAGDQITRERVGCYRRNDRNHLLFREARPLGRLAKGRRFDDPVHRA